MIRILDRLASWWLVQRRGFVVARTTREIKETLERHMWAPRERELVTAMEEAMDAACGCNCPTCALVSIRRLGREQHGEAHDQ